MVMSTKPLLLTTWDEISFQHIIKEQILGVLPDHALLILIHFQGVVLLVV